MLRVTVMIFRDMVESVMLLKEDDCKTQEKNSQRFKRLRIRQLKKEQRELIGWEWMNSLPDRGN